MMMHPIAAVPLLVAKYVLFSTDPAAVKMARVVEPIKNSFLRAASLVSRVIKNPERGTIKGKAEGESH